MTSLSSKINFIDLKLTMRSIQSLTPSQSKKRPRHDEGSADYAAGSFWNKSKLQLRFSRLSILHISPILKRMNLKKFSTDFQKRWLNLKMNTFPTNPSSFFLTFVTKFFFRAWETIKRGGNSANLGKFQVTKKLQWNLKICELGFVSNHLKNVVSKN